MVKAQPPAQRWAARQGRARHQGRGSSQCISRLWCVCACVLSGRSEAWCVETTTKGRRVRCGIARHGLLSCCRQHLIGLFPRCAAPISLETPRHPNPYRPKSTPSYRSPVSQSANQARANRAPGPCHILDKVEIGHIIGASIPYECSCVLYDKTGISHFEFGNFNMYDP